MNNWKHYAALATVTVIATVIAGLIVDHYQEMKLKIISYTCLHRGIVL